MSKSLNSIIKVTSKFLPHLRLWLDPRVTLLLGVLGMAALWAGIYSHGVLAQEDVKSPSISPEQKLGRLNPEAMRSLEGTCTQAFSNSGAIAINDASSASPYPSNITVAGTVGNVAKVSVKLNGFTHTFPSDVDVMLVGPTGRNAIIMSDVGGGDDVAGINLVLDDLAATSMPSAVLPSGTFRPTNFGTGDTFPAPAPAPSGLTFLSNFNNLTANGTWRLYVVDDDTGDSGAFNGGWELNITTACGPGTFQFIVPTAGVLEGNTTVPVQVARTSGSVGAVSVQYQSVPGPGAAASPGADYQPPSGTLSWADGDSTVKSFNVQLLDDALLEGAERFTLQLSNPTGGATLGSLSSQIFTIIDNEEQSSISVSDLTTQTASALVQRIIGNNTPFSNVTYVGALGASGSFSGGTGVIGFEDGIVLTSGSAQNVVGPNTNEDETTVNGAAGDASLNAIAPGTMDASVLQFDFVPTTSSVTFQYVFASDEYNEFANSDFNDVFGFFLNGNNVALIPSTSTPVSINTVNGGRPFGTGAQNPQFFRNNSLFDGGSTLNTEMDGLTTVFNVSATVVPNQTNRIKLAIADVGDTAYDSAVFIRSNSFVGTPQAGQFILAAANQNIIEGNTGTTAQPVTVNRIGGSLGVVTVNYSTSSASATGGGSCGSGVDFINTTGTLTFGNGQTSQTFNVPVCGDSTVEPVETINISLSNPTGGATLGTPVNGTVTIIDNDASVTVGVAPAAVAEDGPVNLVYTLTRTGSTSDQLVVGYSLTGTATAGTDFSCQPSCSGTVSFAPGSNTTAIIVDPIVDAVFEVNETVVLTVLPGAGYSPGPANTATGTINDVSPTVCSPISISVGQSFNGTIGSASCLINSERTDIYSFTGTQGQRIALTMTSTAFLSRIELLDPQGNIVATGPGRLPAAGFFTLPSAGTYTVRAIASQAGTGAYALSLFAAPAQTCTYSVSPAVTDVASTGGTFFFDVLTQPGCAPEAAPVAPAGAIYSIVSYVNGRVTFSVGANAGAERQATISVAGQTHAIRQFGAAAAANDPFAGAQVLTGAGTLPGAPVLGFNTNATAEAGEPAHAGNTAAKSVWYSFTPTANALFSFSTSGSNFDTVMAIYACPAAGGCTFANFTLVGSNDDTTAFDRTSKINFRADAGTRYVIAVDGKNGATGTIQLSFMQYERLFRLYLQNYNGNPITIVPDSVRASNGPIARDGVLVSLGVYEFNLPVSTSPFIVTITGPAGIVWDPNGFPLDTSFRLLDEFMNGPGTGGQNSTSNAQCADGCSVVGFVRNVTESDVSQQRIKVKIGYTRESTQAHRDEGDCLVAFRSDLGIGHARYQCLSYPQTNHDIVPVMPGKRFVEAVYAFSNPIGPMLEDIRTPRFIASDAQTFSISGRVLAGGAGTRVELTYTPPGGTAISRDVRTDANGAYEFRDLLPGTYQPRATREGFLFNTPDAVVLSTANATGIDITSPGACAYAVTNPAQFAAAGGTGNLAVGTTSTCDWEASSEASWIQINSGVGRGNGSIQLTVLPNIGPARTGSVRLRNRTEPVVITQASGCGFTLAAPTQVNFPATGGTGSVNVTATAAECAYAPTATDYCMITSLTAGGTGNSTVNFTVSANLGVARSTTISIGSQTFVLNQAAAAGTHRARFDFDGDGRSDLAVFRPSSGFWYVQRLGATAFDNLPFGLPDDIPTAADFDGDGRTDIGVFRASNQFWYRTNSSNGSFVGEEFGAVGDIPVPADYDGDGRDNIAVFRPSIGTWYTSTSPVNNYGAVAFGQAGDIPRPADYDGDGRADIAVYRPSNGVWYGIRSSNQQMFAVAFGTTGDMPVPADYDGDGRAELAVFRPSEGIWYRMNLATGAFAATQWGSPGDLPVPADYNGDKFADLAVYRPSNGTWYVWSCTNGPLSAAQQFGVSTDRVIPFTN